jgi:short-subunit dehydrogenase
MSRWVLITGAARRIGRAIVLECARAGWDIIVHYHTSQQDAETLAHAIRGMGRKVQLAKLDLADADAVAACIPQLIAETGSIDALVNNASLFEPDALDATGSRHWAVNVTAPQILNEAFYNAHKHQYTSPAPSIINVLDADPSKPQFTHYNRSKRELETLTLGMAKKLAPHVRVNGVALGAIIPSPRESAEHFNKLIASSPLGVTITAQSVAETIVFMMSNPAMTGAIIPIDGGLHLKSQALRP